MPSCATHALTLIAKVWQESKAKNNSVVQTFMLYAHQWIARQYDTIVIIIYFKSAIRKWVCNVENYSRQWIKTKNVLRYTIQKALLTVGCMYTIQVWIVNAPNKDIVNCQNTLDKGVPRMQQWPLDIPQWHITPHPQLSAKIIIAYYMRLLHIAALRANSQIIINSIYLSDIYEEIIHQFSHVGFVFRHKQLCYHGFWKQLTSSILTVRGFRANMAHSPNVGLMSANA